MLCLSASKVVVLNVLTGMTKSPLKSVSPAAFLICSQMTPCFPYLNIKTEFCPCCLFCTILTRSREQILKSSVPASFENYDPRKQPTYVSLANSEHRAKGRWCFLSYWWKPCACPAHWRRLACSLSSSCRYLQLHHEIHCPGLRPWHGGSSWGGVWWWVRGESPLQRDSLWPLAPLSDFCLERTFSSDMNLWDCILLKHITAEEDLG